jgi:FkbM family methyltransferase
MWLLGRIFTNSAKGDRPGSDTAESRDRRLASASIAAPTAAGRSAIVHAAATLAAAGRFGEALVSIENARATAPNDVDLLLARASTLNAWGRLREARDAALRAEALGSRDSALHLQLGSLSFRMGDLREAETWMRKALAIESEEFQPLLNLAFVLQMQSRIPEAADVYERALAISPDDFDALIGLGICRLDQGDCVEAEVQFRRAIERSPESTVAWSRLGVVLGRQKRVAEAREAFERSVAFEARGGGEADAFVNLAIHLRDSGHNAEALALFEENLPRRPDIHAHLSYAHALLKAGRLIEGWHQYEFRWLEYPLLQKRPHFDRPIWAGQDLHGRTILLRGEQGLGDTIQFIRYLPHVKAMGATVLLRVQSELANLLRGFPGVDRLLEPGEPNPDFDFYIHLLSLPRIFGTDVASIPADGPYLYPEHARVERWSKRLGGKGPLRVGIVCAGSPAHTKDQFRSIGWPDIARLWDLEHVRFFSLQKGPAAGQLANSCDASRLVDLGPELEDFCDTAAVIAQLDLVICVDTSVAHLAGALGKTVWILLAQPPDFRWLEDRTDSPWYPTARLFRQRRQGDWIEVIDRVKAALQERVAARDTGMVPSTMLTSGPQFPQLRPLVPAPVMASSLCPAFSAVVEARMGVLQCFPGQDTVGRSVEWYGEYLQAQVDLLARFLRPGAIVVEVGADVGVHALSIAAAIGPEGHLIVFESRAVVQQVLRTNLTANGVNNVTVMRRGLGRAANARPGTLALDSPSREPIPDEPTGADTGTDTLDDLLLERLDWLKINANVSALDILDGGERTLWRLRPWLLASAHDRFALDALASRVREFGYRRWRMETPLFDPKNFNRRYDDIFSGATALALLAIPEEVEADVALDGCVELS